MKPEQWNLVEELYLRAVDLPEEDRETFVNSAAGDRTWLRDEVLRMLERLPASGFLESAPSVEPARDLEGRQLGEFVIDKVVGRGGMGIVYRAVQQGLNRVVAVKVLPPLLASHPILAERFRREAYAASKLQHPGIAGVLSYGTELGWTYCAMEFVDGESLAQTLSRRESLPVTEGAEEGAAAAPSVATFRGCAQLVAQTCRALDYAHGRGVIHRDVKPSNTLIDSSGRPRLIDFGLALLIDREHITLSGETLGTPAYMSPEQASSAGKQVDHRTDIYSSGALLYELLTGRPPYTGKNHLEILKRIATEEIKPIRRLNAKVPVPLETICLRALTKERHKRYSTAAEMAEDLERYTRGESIRARRPSLLERAGRFAKRRSRELLVGAVILLLATLGWYTQSTARAAHLRAVARVELAASADGPSSVTLLSIAPHPWDPGTVSRHLELDGDRGRSLELEPGYYRASFEAADGTLREVPLEAVAGEQSALTLEAGTRRADEDMVAFEPGELAFEFWSPPAGDAKPTGPRAYEAEYSGFEIDRDLVSNEEFAQFLEEAGALGEAEEWKRLVLPSGDLPLEEWNRRPAVHMSRDQARRYAAHVGARLPSYVELVVANQGGSVAAWTPAEEDYPTGLARALPEAAEAQGIPPARAAYLAYSKPVGESEPVAGGIRDPIGNVACWAEHPHLAESPDGGVEVGSLTVFAGVSWSIHQGSSGQSLLRQSMIAPRHGDFNDVGFRCARTLPAK